MPDRLRSAIPEHCSGAEVRRVADQTLLPMGEDVIFRFTNTGAIPHEAMFGPEHQQEESAEAGDPHRPAATATRVITGASPRSRSMQGGTSELVLRFDTAGELWIGCHLPGHWDAGMSATFQIA